MTYACGPVPGYPPDHINAVITHIIHFLGLLVFYLGVKLPFETEWTGKKFGVGQPWIGAGKGGESGSWAKYVPFHVDLRAPHAVFTLIGYLGGRCDTHYISRRPRRLRLRRPLSRRRQHRRQSPRRPSHRPQNPRHPSRPRSQCCSTTSVTSPMPRASRCPLPSGRCARKPTGGVL